MTTFNQNSFFEDDEPADELTGDAATTIEGDSADDAIDTATGHEPADDSTLADTVSDQSPSGAKAPQADTVAAATTSVLTDPGQEAVDAFFGPAPLQRERLARPPLIPRWVWIALGSVVAVAVVALGVWFWSTRLVNISVPSVAGLDVGVARTRLIERGLDLKVTEQQFSAQPKQTVLSQTPAADTKLKRGDVVSVVISAGSEQFAMPDVVGNGLLLAQGKLETKGLEVRVDSQPSQMPSDTVLASNPAAGQFVHTGDIVRLTVSAPGPKTELLLPFDMRGVTVVLDPAPVNDALGDVPLDVARRVRSLIEASHGSVRTTRALADTSTLEAAPARAQRAAGTATVAIGLTASTVGSGGLVVSSPSPVLPHASASAKLASVLASDLASEAGAVSSSTSTTDTVLGAANSPWSRIQLGSYASREDAAKFADPNWEDTIARGIYRALGNLYGKKPAGT